MRIDTLSPAEGATRPAKRLGRGIGSGLGKTSGKGHKGQWARSGGGVRPGFEGGQMPIARRVPKKGFNHNGKKDDEIPVTAKELEYLRNFILASYGYVTNGAELEDVKNNCGLKVLGDGELKVSLTVKAAKFSASAKEAIEAAKGTAETL